MERRRAALVGAERRLRRVAEDLVQHVEDRVASTDGKAVVVCTNRRICVALHGEIVRLGPEWHTDDDTAGAIKVVMTGSASDPFAWQPHIGNEARRDAVVRRAKDPNDPLRLVPVRDTWLAGFDAHAMHAMDVDTPMRGHGLVQAIASVNRVFRDKPAGWVVDDIAPARCTRWMTRWVAVPVCIGSPARVWKTPRVVGAAERRPRSTYAFTAAFDVRPNGTTVGPVVPST